MSKTISFLPVSEENISTTAALAKEIWTEHYTPIIGSAQVSYMVEQFQSEKAMRHQISFENYSYYLISDENHIVGYFALVFEPDHLFLSKLYVRKECRRKGYAAAALTFIKSLAAEKDLQKIRLTVNKKNTGSIAAYEYFGFKKVQDVVTDIGAGFVMDDYIMEYPIS